MKRVLLVSAVGLFAASSALAELPLGMQVANAHTATGGLWYENKFAGAQLSGHYWNKGMKYVDNPAITWSTDPSCTAVMCIRYQWVGGKVTGTTSGGIKKVAPQGLVNIDAGGAPGPDFIVLGGIIDGMLADVSPGFWAPGAIGKASCQTSPTTITEREAFWTAQSNTSGSSENWETSVKTSNKYNVGLEGGLDWFGFAETKWKVGYEFAQENAKSHGLSVTNSWTDTQTYISENTVGTTITPGTIGTTALTTPRIHYYGLFKMGRLFKDGAAGAPMRAIFNNNPSDIRYRIYRDNDIGQTTRHEKTAWWHGRISVPVSYLKAGSVPFNPNAVNPVWFVDSPRMNVSQYKTYCKGDIAARNYAPSMKRSLCLAGIDKPITCK